MLKELLEGEESELGLDVGVLAQVPPGVTLLGAERLGNAEDVSKGGKAGLEVELGALGEVSLLSVVVEGEEGGSSLDLGLNHARRGNLEEAEVGVGGAEGLEEGGANLEGAGDGLSTDDKVASVGEEIGSAVLRLRSRSALVPSRLTVLQLTSETLLRKASSPPGALPTTENQSAESS